MWLDETPCKQDPDPDLTKIQESIAGPFKLMSQTRTQTRTQTTSQTTINLNDNNPVQKQSLWKNRYKLYESLYVGIQHLKTMVLSVGHVLVSMWTNENNLINHVTQKRKRQIGIIFFLKLVVDASYGIIKLFLGNWMSRQHLTCTSLKFINILARD